MSSALRASNSSKRPRPHQDERKRIATPGPKQAWFKDPAESILSVIQE